MGMNSRGGGQADRLADVAHRRRVAVLGRVFANEVENLLLTLGQIHVGAAPVSSGLDDETNMCSYSSAGRGRNQGGRSPSPSMSPSRAILARSALVAELVDAQG